MSNSKTTPAEPTPPLMALNKKDHAVEMLEQGHGGKLISFEEAKEKGYTELVQWLTGIARYGNIKKTMLVFDHEDRINIKFFTCEHSYNISARLPDDEGSGYLGCIASCRKSKVGETCTRGNDLADGKYLESTFIEIMADIVSYEIKNLQCF